MHKLSLKEKYCKIQPFGCKEYDMEHGEIELYKKPKYENIKHTAYLWEKNSLTLDEIDSFDLDIVNKSLNDLIIGHENKYKLFKLTTLHTCAYYGFFKPSLDEVCDAIPDIVYLKSHKIYVTTNTYSNYGSKCYVDFIDRHLGITYVLCVIDQCSQVVNIKEKVIELEEEMYDKIQPFVCKNDDILNGLIRLIEKPKYDDIDNICYLWNRNPIRKENLDNYIKSTIGKTVNELKDDCVYHYRKYYLFKFTTFHKNGDNYGMIKPTLGEVCNSIQDIIYDKSIKIFVTTDIYNGKQYVDFIDRYIGETYVLCRIKHSWFPELDEEN